MKHRPAPCGTVFLSIMNNPTVKFLAIAAGVFVVAFLGSGFFTLLLPKMQQPAEETSGQPQLSPDSLTPESLESYKAAQTALSEYRAAPACAGPAVDGLLAKLAELYSDADATSLVAGIAGADPQSFPASYGETVLTFADIAIRAGCLDLADGQLQDVKTKLPASAYPDINVKVDAALQRIAAARTSGAPQR